MPELDQPVEPIRPIPKGYRDLLVEFHNKNTPERLPKGELLSFNLGEHTIHLTAYNPAPIVIDGQLHMWARVEERADEKNSAVILFKQGEDGTWTPVEGAPVFKGLQDPFYCGRIDGDHVFGGVQIYEVAGSSYLGYRTVFYRYKNSYTELIDPHGDTVAPFAIGPEKMKDIRLIQLEPGRIGVFTRPQGPGSQFGGRGQIGYVEIASLGELQSALTRFDQQKDPRTLIRGLFVDSASGEEEWGGANQLCLLPDGKIGVLGHIAGFNGDGKKDYYPITFIFDPKDKSVSHVKIIATAAQFPAVEAKKGDLGSILFSGGLVRSDEGYSWLYVGIGDSKGGRIRIQDPFVE
ncbi:MAG: DUF1861 family protein [Patescibacteria group bacterium]